MERFFSNVAELMIDTVAMKNRKIKRLNNSNNYLKYYFEIFFTNIFGKYSLFKKIFRFLELRLNRNKIFDLHIKKYNPEIIFSTDIFNWLDAEMVKSGKLKKIKVVGMVASWDNNTTKGLMRIVPNKLIVQNEVIADESISIQKITPNIINIVGIAHYDLYAKYKPITKKDYFDNLGVKTSEKIIVFSPAGNKFISTDWQICEILKKAILNKKINFDVKVLVRTHPSNYVDFKNFTFSDSFILENPGISFDGLGQKKNELDKKSLYHLLDTLQHCDLVINTVSSIVIDACIFDKPVITIGFDGWENSVLYGNSVERYLKDDNMQKLLNNEGSAIVKNEESLIYWINKYLDNPNIHKEGRKKIIEQQCWRLDGKAKHRILDVIID